MLTFASLKLPPRQQAPRSVNVTRNGTEVLQLPTTTNITNFQQSISNLWGYYYNYYTPQLQVELRLAGMDLCAPALNL